jgi:hypothetical protein
MDENFVERSYSFKERNIRGSCQSSVKKINFRKSRKKIFFLYQHCLCIFVGTRLNSTVVIRPAFHREGERVSANDYFYLYTMFAKLCTVYTFRPTTYKLQPSPECVARRQFSFVWDIKPFACYNCSLLVLIIFGWKH